MNSTTGKAGRHVLFCVNVFVVFLILFEDRLQLPAWLQVTGRLHPVVLHFPIVLLLLYSLLEFSGLKHKYPAQPLYQLLTSNLLLLGAVTACITVIMGVFLSKEGNYDLSILRWHKWSGIFIAAMASLIYWLKSYSWFSVSTAKAIIVLTTISIFIAGHFGGSLTHGDDFVLAPINKNQPANIPFSEAEVYANLIQPLFASRCQTCHNKEKNKGNLRLLDSVSITTGGKSGELFVAGNPDISLLLKRIHLPEDSKKHMPPAGKPQLLESEKQLLYWWIRSGAVFNKKLSALPPQDSLRIIAADFISGDEDHEEHFAFAAADPKIIQSLNNKDRTVYEISKQSPALGVNLFNKASYSTKLLDDLKPVKEQIISLEADRLPVKNNDLKQVSMFTNLRKLSLNFTDVTVPGLKELVNLKELNSLSLSGTKLNYKELQTLIKSFVNLKKVFVWEAGLDTNEVKLLQKAYPAIEWNAGFAADAAAPLQLNKVILLSKTQVFNSQMNVKLKHSIKGVEIRYTTDGSEPDSLRSPVFTDGIEIKSNTLIKSRAYKQGWITSETNEFRFFKSSIKPDSIFLAGPLNEKFPALGKETFFDGQLGAYSPFGDKWAGISGAPMILTFKFNQPVSINAVQVQFLTNLDFGVLAPAAVEIRGGDLENETPLLSLVKVPAAAKDVKTSIGEINNKLKPQTVRYLKLIISPSNWPAWHEKKGKPALLLIDEIFLN